MDATEDDIVGVSSSGTNGADTSENGAGGEALSSDVTSVNTTQSSSGGAASRSATESDSGIAATSATRPPLAASLASSAGPPIAPASSSPSTNAPAASSAPSPLPPIALASLTPSALPPIVPASSTPSAKALIVAASPTPPESRLAAVSGNDTTHGDGNMPNKLRGGGGKRSKQVQRDVTPEPLVNSEVKEEVKNLLVDAPRWVSKTYEELNNTWGGHWRRLLETWVILEGENKFSTVKGGIAAAGRPAAVSGWISGGRWSRLKVFPRTLKESFPEFLERYDVWWDGMQPDWRSKGDVGWVRDKYGWT